MSTADPFLPEPEPTGDDDGRSIDLAADATDPEPAGADTAAGEPTDPARPSSLPRPQSGEGLTADELDGDLPPS